MSTAAVKDRAHDKQSVVCVWYARYPEPLVGDNSTAILAAPKFFHRDKLTGCCSTATFEY